MFTKKIHCNTAWDPLKSREAPLRPSENPLKRLAETTRNTSKTPRNLLGFSWELLKPFEATWNTPITSWDPLNLPESSKDSKVLLRPHKDTWNLFDKYLEPLKAKPLKVLWHSQNAFKTLGSALKSQEYHAKPFLRPFFAPHFPSLGLSERFLCSPL